MASDEARVIEVKLIDYMGGDREVVQAARLTAGSSQMGDSIAEKDKGLINMLMRDRHGSPFEHAVFKFSVDVPLFVAHELTRHRIASFNEESGRYTEMRGKFYNLPEGREVIQEGKPGAYLFSKSAPVHEIAKGEIDLINRQAWFSYLRMLDAGIAKEVARMVLPQTLYKKMVVTINARSLMNLISLRVGGKAESRYPTFPMKEISWMAEQMEESFQKIMPVTHGAFVLNGRVAP